MTFREKLADWISGGALTRLQSYKFALDSMGHHYDLMCGDVALYTSVLHRIDEQETPSANATVKRMARMAREALGE